MPDTPTRLTSHPYVLLTLTAIIWAGNTIAGKLAAGHVSPFLLTSMRWAIAMTLFYLIARPALRRDWPVIRRNWPHLAILGAMGFTAFNSLFYLALNYTTAIHVAIAQAATPLVIFVFNFLIFRVRTNWLQALGFLLTLVGVIITITDGNPFAVAGYGINIGDLYILVAVVAYGVYSVLLRSKPPMHWLSFMTVLAVFAFLSSLPGTAIEIALDKVIWPDLTGWLVAVYVALLPSLAAQSMWLHGVEAVGANRSGVFFNLIPIFSAAMAVSLLGEPFGVYQAAALTLVVGGVWLAQIQRSARPPVV